VDDHPIVREGLARRIERQGDLTVCGEAESAADALMAVNDLAPDLVVVDLTLKDKSGLELIKDLRVRHPQVPVLVLSMHDETHYAERALRAGAGGYIMKQEAAENVLVAIRRVLDGQVYLSDRMADRLLGAIVGEQAGPSQSPVDRLSDRELEVFEMIGTGLGTREIADRLHVSIKTVEAYRANIKDKLHLQTAMELAHRAFHWVQNEMGT
jgi:DNA-binding NarL/FixJ family response regulator